MLVYLCLCVGWRGCLSPVETMDQQFELHHDVADCTSVFKEILTDLLFELNYRKPTTRVNTQHKVLTLKYVKSPLKCFSTDYSFLDRNI